MNRRHRLRGGRAFAAVRARRAGAAAGPIRVAVAPNAAGVARVGFSIPRAVGGAVVRNRIRRRLRAVLSPRLAEVGGLDLVVAAGRDVAEMPHAALVAGVEGALDGARRRLTAGVVSPGR